VDECDLDAELDMLGDELEEDGLGDEVGDAMPDYLQPARKYMNICRCFLIYQISLETHIVLIYYLFRVYVYHSGSRNASCG
jgi:hypothetical protein